MNAINFLRFLFLAEVVSGLISPLSPPRVRPATAGADLQSELDAQGLGLCHGLLHASGVRCLADVKSLTSVQLDALRLDAFDYKAILPFVGTEANDNEASAERSRHHRRRDAVNLSTSVDGAFDRPARGRFEVETLHDFDWKAIEKDIFTGKLFTVEQCEQMNRMAEFSAYRGVGTIGAGWTDQIYTLTAQHMCCKEIPGFLPTTKIIFDQLVRAIYSLYPGRLVPGSIVYESDGEPHLVKYNGRAKGTQLHTDNSEFVYITVNAMLSDPSDYTGGGTYISEIDDTIKLKQGEMLIHLGDMEHAGAEITSGVRRVLIAFLACTWVDGVLNIEKVDQARVEEHPTWAGPQNQ